MQRKIISKVIANTEMLYYLSNIKTLKELVIWTCACHVHHGTVKGNYPIILTNKLIQDK